ncbi:Uncharacterised protein [Burkholderia pseudomallei]|uniref:hypothetical protein n=1 Tax=Burkholderia pseudomallei TaxID=28450 RepID=UPI0001722B84|nr:hypothetical protein [Burkholderia pseudomallei]EDS86549.1 hypothetical protein BURPSS13_G0086 [Burkholderia pseudomallei S13]MBF3439886.1 hypothetical protein [Burkholderia pseudomallei]MBF3464428.1 hypothetical protein [Burkholderia pseudomallei]OMS24001.1 hypothetical protein AQ738_07190 [Burkholderia pseudomallei]CAJ3839875.1 Uncharacterised protein [Burkholderia pseudomallei]
MWASAFQISVQRVTHELLSGSVLPLYAKTFEKVSAAIAVRATLCAKQLAKPLFFLVPGATPSTARHVTAGLLIGNHAHANGGGILPDTDVRALFKGDIVLVTQAVTQSKVDLEHLSIASQVLADIWEVAPLTRHAAPRTKKPRLYVTNPGWVVENTMARRFGAIIIDASHPRTLASIRRLLDAARGCTSNCFVVAPPLPRYMLAKCGYPEKAAVWLWDPQAIVDADRAAESPNRGALNNPPRELWVCDSDPEADNALSVAFDLMASASKQAEGRYYPGLRQAWSILNRLRQLTAPLVQLEQVAAESWAGGLRKRVEELKDVAGHGDPLWETTWPAIRESVEAAYRLFLKRNETPKFWALAARVSDLLADGPDQIRVVVPSASDRDLLVPMLEATVDRVSDALGEGRLEVATTAEEARLIAEGRPAHTLLTGQRPSASRYLDIFPGVAVEEFIYPFEQDIEAASLTRLYNGVEQLEAEDERLALLSKLGLNPSSKANASVVPCRQAILVKRGQGHAISLVVSAQVDGKLDIDGLAGVDVSIEHSGGAGSGSQQNSRAGTGVEVTFVTGGSARYYPNEMVDVYFDATDQMQRMPAALLQAGWRIITFVDGRYDSLFQRITEAVHQRLPPSEQIALKVWEEAKSRLSEKFPRKTLLHEHLAAMGLSSNYCAVVAWFRDDESEVLAPQQYEDFAAVARATGVYSSPGLMRHTFNCIQRERGRNRAAGRALKKLLRAIRSGEGYEDALESARSIDASVADALAAVELLEIKDVRVHEGAGHG